MKGGGRPDRVILEEIAHRAMLERGLLPDYSRAALVELQALDSPASADGGRVRDLTGLAWCSIDNDDSLDLDQLSVATELAGDRIKIQVAIADVDALVDKGTAIDDHAAHNTSTVYTAARIFSMLPEKLSTDLTSLNPHEDRLAVVAEMVVKEDGSLEESDVYRARVRNQAKLGYESVSAWLAGEGPVPEALARVEGLDANVRTQDRAAQRMKILRHAQGALDLKTIQARPVFDGDVIRDLKEDTEDRAKDIIEDFMIAANGVTARYLASHDFPSIRRVVHTPRRWERIAEIAADHDFALPAEPDAQALEEFLVQVNAEDPVRFPDVSLSVVKLLGAGEYVATRPGEESPGHFGLAVKDYGHSTAPNRRFTDLLTQRLLKAAFEGAAPPYSVEELDDLAAHCTKQEDAVNRVERQVGKSAAVLLLASRVGEQFPAIVTGAASKGTWVRLLDMPVEGRVIQGHRGLDVGDRIRVQLASVDVRKGFIDFKRVRSQK